MRRCGWSGRRLASLACVVWLVAPAPAEPPHLAAVVAPEAPIIDGLLVDECWGSAAHAAGFYFSQENRPETEFTEAWICVDADYLYVAFYCHDSRPDVILSQQTQRGGSLERDDYVALHLDPSRRAVERYTFRVSPNGTQSDSMPQSGSGNIAWRGDWTAAAQRVADGYTVEMAIPLAILNYPRGQTSFGIAFGRNLEREEESSFWPAMPDRFELADIAVLGPLRLRDPSNPPAILPYAIGRVDEDGATIQSGLDIKHVFGTGVTGLFTANPDFLNIEDIVETIAFTYTERFLPDTRPFFSEGGGYFPGSRAFHSRRIPSVNTGVKAFGRMGHSRFGAVSTMSSHGRLDGAMDYTYQFTPHMSLGSGLVVRTDEDPTGLVSQTHFDSYHPMGPVSISWGGDFYHSAAQRLEGNSWNAYFDYGGEGRVSFNAGYDMVHPDFRSPDGFVPEPDTRGWNVGLSGWKRTQGHFIQNHSWWTSHGRYTHRDGSLLSTGWSGGGFARFDNGTSLDLSASLGERPPNHDWTVSSHLGWGLESLYSEGGLGLTAGHRGGAQYFFAQINQGWAPFPALRFNLREEITRRIFADPTLLDEMFTQTVATATYELDPFTTISGRFLERDGSLNFFLAYRHAPASGRGFYLFFGDPNSSKTEYRLQVKLIWPL